MQATVDPAPDTLKIRLVSPAVWRTVLATEFVATSEEITRFATEGLLALHNQHVGITPRLMAEVASALLEHASRPSADGILGRAFDRLAESLTVDGSSSALEYRDGGRLGILLSHRPSYVLFRLVGPLVAAASRALGRSYLFCADEIDTDVSEEEYRDYQRELHEKSVLITEKPEENQATAWLDLFWRERALTLASISHPSLPRTGSSSPLPDPDPLAVALFLRLEPKVSERPRVREPARLAPFRQDVSRGPGEGGVTGIRVTKRLEDMGSALISEWASHPIERLDRLVNTGFFAYQREPRDTENPDVLIVAQSPPIFWGTLAADLLKACWFDFAVRTGFVLHKMDLLTSEFRWIEGDPNGRARVCKFPLEGLPSFPGGTQARLSEDYRRLFTHWLRWLPQFLDLRSDFKSLTVPQAQTDRLTSIEQRTVVDLDIGQWLLDAWGDHSTAKSVDERSSHDETQMRKPDDFGYVHVMNFLPHTDESAEHGVPDKAVLAQLSGRLRARNRYKGSTSITWVPSISASSADWGFTTLDRPRSRVTQDNPNMTASNLAGKLVECWLDHILKEMGRA